MPVVQEFYHTQAIANVSQSYKLQLCLFSFELLSFRGMGGGGGGGVVMQYSTVQDEQSSSSLVHITSIAGNPQL